MKQSLREQLNNWIQRQGYVSYSEVKLACESGKFKRYYKISNAERRLRRSESPNVEAEMQGKYIKGYRWTGAPIKYITYRLRDSLTDEPRGEIKVAEQSKLL